MNERELNVWLERRRLEEKRLYFLLASAGTCIGFAITQIDTVVSAASASWLVVALVLFALSFASGLRMLSLDDKVLRANNVMLAQFNANHPSLHETIREIADERVFNDVGPKIAKLRRAQVLSLVIGAFCVAVSKLLTCAECGSALAALFGQEP